MLIGLGIFLIAAYFVVRKAVRDGMEDAKTAGYDEASRDRFEATLRDGGHDAPTP